MPDEAMTVVASFSITLVCMSMLALLAEFTIPDGPMKNAVSVSVGLLFLSAVKEQILGIFARIGG